jgi:hypothetical protein
MVKDFKMPSQYFQDLKKKILPASSGDLLDYVHLPPELCIRTFLS